MSSLPLLSWSNYYFYSQKYPGLDSKLHGGCGNRDGEVLLLSGGYQRGLTKAPNQACPLPSSPIPWTLTPSLVAPGGHSPLPFSSCPGRDSPPGPPFLCQVHPCPHPCPGRFLGPEGNLTYLESSATELLSGHWPFSSRKQRATSAPTPSPPVLPLLLNLDPALCMLSHAPPLPWCFSLFFGSVLDPAPCPGPPTLP